MLESWSAGLCQHAAIYQLLPSFNPSCCRPKFSMPYTKLCSQPSILVYFDLDELAAAGDAEYDAFVHQHGRRHRSAEEYQGRAQVFRDNKRLVELHNAGKHSYK